MIVKCLACKKEMIADDKHRGYQTCGCENQTMVDWCDEYCCRFGGIDPSKIEVDGELLNNTNAKGEQNEEGV